MRLLEQQGDTALIPRHWEELALAAAEVSRLEPEPAQQSLRSALRGLELALQARQEPQILRALDTLADEVRYEFFLVDKQLKERCGTLRLVGIQLEAVLSMVPL